jgi:hypothetical protein
MGAIEYLKKIPDTYDTYGSFVKLSEDYGNTWGKAIKVPVTAPHGPILLKNGKLLYVGKEFHSDCEIGKGDILSYESSDEGKTWKLLSTVKDTKGLPSYIYTEPHSIELANGRILCGIRVQDGDQITIHLCHSDDGGKTWTEPKPLGNSGSPPHFMLHSTGAVILSYGRREVPYGQRALISYDNGETFTKEITLRDDSMHSDLGYPSSVELDDGSIVTVYYQDGVNGDHYRSLIYTRWNLDEV